MENEPLSVSWELLRAAAQLVEGIQNGVVAEGFTAIRPVHGYALARISQGDATVTDVAEHLGVTKQAASQLIEHLVQQGYVDRQPHPDDGRAWLLSLSRQGRACTRAAARPAAAVVTGWRSEMGAQDFAAVHRALGRVVSPGPLRPPW
jgi:DNA-binding MarR family transcriptional regulator